MKEKWKLICEYKSDSKTHLEGDKCYISNKGRVRINDIILDYGKGLYLGKDKEVRIYGCKLPESNIYRTIYKLFIGPLKYGSNYNIHHIDCNHMNNSADNLIQITSKEHAKLHNISKVIEYNEEIDKLAKLPLRSQSKLFFIELTVKRKEERRKIREEERKKLQEARQKEKQKERQKERQKEIDNKLANGWKYDKNGRIYNPNAIKDIVLYRTKESYKTSAEKISLRYKNDPTYRQKTSESAKDRKWINNGKERKMVKPDELEYYLNNGYELGYKKCISH